MFPERIETDRLELAPLGIETVAVLADYGVCSGNSGEDVDRLDLEPGGDGLVAAHRYAITKDEYEEVLP